MALIERIQENTNATNWRSTIPMEYVYTAGRAGEMFFTALRDEGKFLGSRCPKCGTVSVPPRIFCEACFISTEGETVEVPNRGAVHTYTLCHQDYQEKVKEKPSVLAFIRLEGSCGGLFHWLGDVDPDAVCVGMPVTAVLKPQGQRQGSILDIEYFKPC
jgi:uncharacterized OB-fold protein